MVIVSWSEVLQWDLVSEYVGDLAPVTVQP